MSAIRTKGTFGLWQLSLGATGVVFGDLGTSPLYAFQESFIGPHRLPIDAFHVLGVLSLLVWTLILVPMLFLAAAATVIASQSIISGAFSVTQQAVQFGYLPRLSIRHTSADERGQVYAPTVNILLFLAVVAIVLGFRSSAALAAAFGLAVTATMVLTTLMIGYVIFGIWKWNRSGRSRSIRCC